MSNEELNTAIDVLYNNTVVVLRHLNSLVRDNTDPNVQFYLFNAQDYLAGFIKEIKAAKESAND